MVARFGVEVAFHFVLFIVALVCTGTTARRIGKPHRAAAVQKETRPSAVGRESPGSVELVEKKAFNYFQRLVSVDSEMLKGELLRHRLGSHVDVTEHFCEGSHDRSDDPSGLAALIL